MVLLGGGEPPSFLLLHAYIPNPMWQYGICIRRYHTSISMLLFVRALTFQKFVYRLNYSEAEAAVSISEVDAQL